VPAECHSINTLCEGPAQNFGQVSNRDDDLNRVAMNEHTPSIRVNRPDFVERKNMVWTLQRPTARNAGAVLKMLQEALMKPKSVKLPIGIEPVPITRHGIGRIESRAAKDMRGYLRTFLRRFRSDRMHPPELRGQELKHAELASDALTPPIAAARCRIGMNQLPDSGHLIRRIRCHQLVEKRGPRARQAGDKDRPLDPLVKDLWCPPFLRPHPEQIA